MSVYLLVCRHCISNQWIAEGIDKKKSPLLFLMNPEFHNKRTVLTPSFRRSERSGEISRRCGASLMVAGDLSAQRFNKLQSLYPPYRQVPLEIRMSMSSIQSFSGGSTDQNSAPHPVISTVGAEWRNLAPKWGEPHGGRRSLGSAFQ